jgi:dihydroorotate dehydrogenase
MYYHVNDKRLERTVFGLKFKNPVGLAAGFDKNASHYNELSNFGFGFIEIGTLTPDAQEGNTKPRMFRLSKDEGLINRMGFNNGGVEAAVKRLKNRKGDLIVGGNIGKNTVTPSEDMIQDFKFDFKALCKSVDYITVNVSCPNVNSPKALKEKSTLVALLTSLKDINIQEGANLPILMKIGPDLGDTEIKMMADVVIEADIDGMVATNTSSDWSLVNKDKGKLDAIKKGRPEGPGGLSGTPILSKSTHTIKKLYEYLGDKYPIIGVGGIYTAEDAIEKINAGAVLVQVFTGFVYEGPGMIKRINNGLLKNS